MKYTPIWNHRTYNTINPYPLLIIAGILMLALFFTFIVANSGTVTLSNFNSVDELKTFLSQDDTDKKVHLIITNPDGKVGLNSQCEDRAFNLVSRAEQIGKRIEGEILTKQECLKYAEFLDTTPEALEAMGDNAHYICKAVIGNQVFYIEPTNDKVWLAAARCCWSRATCRSTRPSPRWCRSRPAPTGSACCSLARAVGRASTSTSRDAASPARSPARRDGVPALPPLA